MFLEHPLGHSFFIPPREIEVATDLVDLAADAHVRGDSVEARASLAAANIKILREYRSCFLGKNKHPRVTEIRGEPVALNALPVLDRDKRMPTKRESLEIFNRDGWRCRYCGIRVALTSTISKFNKRYPDEIMWHARPYEQRNAVFNIIAASLDHVVPHARGGASDDENLVTACGCCNYGKKHRTLAELRLSDPRLRPPKVDRWDGLGRIL